MVDKIILIVYLALAIGFLLYNLVCYKKKKAIYFLDQKLKKEFIVINDKFYNMQLKFSTVCSVLLITVSIVYIADLFGQGIPLFTSIYLLIFIANTNLLKWISLRNNYAKEIDYVS